MDSSTFCLENYVQNSKSEDNFLIRPRNKTGKSFHKDSILKIPPVLNIGII